MSDPDNSAFRRNFAKLIKRAGDKVELVVRRTALELQTSMVQLSPVDTGRFRNNWNCGIGVVVQTTTETTDREGTGALGRTAEALGSWKPGQTIYLTNSLPYAKPLEYGHSSQAPSGMVRLTVTNYSLALQRALLSSKKV